MIAILSWLAWSSKPVTGQQDEPTCRETLPTVQWLGEGAGEYILEDGYNIFIVKRLSPFRFDIELRNRQWIGSDGLHSHRSRARMDLWWRLPDPQHLS